MSRSDGVVFQGQSLPNLEVLRPIYFFYMSTYCSKIFFLVQACLAAGWDIISPEEYSISKSLQKKLGINKSQFLNHKFNSQYGTLIQVTRGDVLQSKDQLCRGFQFLLKVNWTPFDLALLKKVQHNAFSYISC